MGANLAVSSVSPDSLLEAIIARDPQAFAAWMRVAEPRVRASVARYAAAVDTEVVVQETLMRVWLVAHRIELDDRGDCTIRFAIRMARNLAVDATRRSARHASKLEELETRADEPNEPKEPAGPDPHLRDRLRDCINGLRRAPQLALRARLERGHKSADRDLAAGLEMTLNTFLKNVGRARKALVDCLRRHGIQITDRGEVLP